MNEHSSVASIDRVKVLVLGDSGVGKTSLAQLIASGQAFSRGPGWTAGCNVEVRWHDYAAGTTGEQPYFVEIWDIGGCQALQTVRPLFYGGAHGYILVHDMTNRKSLQNLKTVWLNELANTAAANAAASSSSSLAFHSSSSPTLSSGSSALCLLPPQAPCLLVGTKLDLVNASIALNNNAGSSAGSLDLPIHHRKPTSGVNSSSSGYISSTSSSGSSWPGLGVLVTAESICKQVGGAEHITVDCHNARSLAPGSSNSVAITRFFDKVIDTKLTLGSHALSSSGGLASLSSSSSSSSNLVSLSVGSATNSSLLSGSTSTAFSNSRSSVPFQQNVAPSAAASLAATDRRRVLLK